jgi:RimJ/RimL family protein N-acetyltransferase
MEHSEIEIGWTFIVRSHWGGPTNREVKRLMLDHAFTFVDTVIFWVGEENWRSQGAMTKIGGVKRDRLLRGSRPARCLTSSSKSARMGISRAAERWWPEVYAHLIRSLGSRARDMLAGQPSVQAAVRGTIFL